MKQGKETCKQILNRHSSLPNSIRLQVVAWLAFWRRCVCLCSWAYSNFPSLYLCTHCCFSLCLSCKENWKFWRGTFAVESSPPNGFEDDAWFFRAAFEPLQRLGSECAAKDTRKRAAGRCFGTQSQPTVQAMLHLLSVRDLHLPCTELHVQRMFCYIMSGAAITWGNWLWYDIIHP